MAWVEWKRSLVSTVLEYVYNIPITISSVKSPYKDKGRWKILYVFVPSETTLKCPISSQATEDVFYFHFSFSQARVIRQLDRRPFWKSYSGWRCARFGKVTTGLMWAALVMSSLGTLSCALTGPRAGVELWYLDTVGYSWIQIQSYWWLHLTDPRSDTLGCLFTPGFIAYSLCSFALLTRTWVTAWPNNQLIKHLRALVIRNMKSQPS